MSLPYAAVAMKQPSWGGCCWDGGGVLEVKVAVHVVFAIRLNVVSTETPLHPPLQPVNLEPLAGLAVKVTSPWGNSAWHAVPQMICESLERTLPIPFPASTMVTTRNPPISRTPAGESWA